MVYPIDDVYIHMAMAKNFALHGVWGVTKYEFASATSSPFWTLLLSLFYFVFGVSELIPLLLNIIIGTVVLGWLNWTLKRHDSKPLSTFIILASVLFLTPLVALTFSGLEHTMHVFLTLVFVHLSANALTKDYLSSGERIVLLGIALLLPAVRYEGLFLVFVVSCLFLLRRKLMFAFLLGGVAVLPITLYGLFSVAKGWYFVPNSVLLKGNMPDVSSLKGVLAYSVLGLTQIGQTPHILLLVLPALITLYFQISREPKAWTMPIAINVVFLATLYLHMQFAGVGLYFRYEAYLVALGIYAISWQLLELLPHRYPFNKHWLPKLAVLTAIVLLSAGHLIRRGVLSFSTTPDAQTNIYDQQYQMGLFFKEFYEGKGVAANDIGAINYLADIDCLDLWGLASIEVAKAKRSKLYNSKKISQLANAKAVKVAIVYDHWYGSYGGVPPEWIQVGQWKISNNKITGGDTVSIYAVDPAERESLILNLQSFSSRLPTTVSQLGAYTN